MAATSGSPDVRIESAYGFAEIARGPRRPRVRREHLNLTLTLVDTLVWFIVALVGAGAL